MIPHIAELNRVVIAVRELADLDGRVEAESVIRQCSSLVIEGRLPDHEQSLEFAVAVGLVARDGTKVLFTSQGQAFVGLNPESYYELSADQRRLLIRSCFFDGQFRSQTQALLESFSPAYEAGTFRWSPVDSPRLEGEPRLVDHLMQLGLIVPWADGLEVSPEYVDTVSTFLDEGKGFSAEAFEEILRERKEVGELAERLVFAFETERLRNAGYEVEAWCARRISKLKANAGYDIESFTGRSPALQFDRFIETKGARSAEVRFIFTENEIAVARRLRSRYWIYFQGGIDLRTGTAGNEILMFQDPVETILSNGDFSVTQHGVIVQGRMRGAPVRR